MDATEVLEVLDSRVEGLSDAQAAARRADVVDRKGRSRVLAVLAELGEALTEPLQLLLIDEQLVVELAANGKLPGRRLGDQWRFSRSALLASLDSAHDADQPQ